jgi:alpha-1,2-mannosyltransferase
MDPAMSPATKRSPGSRKWRFGHIGLREARLHALALCAVLWTTAAVSLSQPGLLDVTGRLKFPDFVHFYVLGDLVARGRHVQLYDADAQYRRQVELVPQSAPMRFVPIYGPQTALLFAPLSRLDYLPAAFVWAGLTIAVYLFGVWAVWVRIRSALPHGMLVVLAAAGFPPIWYLVLHGQTTAIPFAAFALAWLAIRRQRSFAAGLALGLIAVKPQFGLVLALVVVLCREWSLMGGVLASVAIQVGTVTAVMGFDVWAAYVEALRQLPAVAAQLEPKAYLLHSVRAVTNLLPGALGETIFAAVAFTVAWQASRVWRSTAPLTVRFAVLVFAATFANPHLTVYDATVLALPLLWLAPWVSRDARLGELFWPLIYALFIFLLLPSALLVRVQVSVIVQGLILYLVLRNLPLSGPSESPGDSRSPSRLPLRTDQAGSGERSDPSPDHPHRGRVGHRRAFAMRGSVA